MPAWADAARAARLAAAASLAASLAGPLFAQGPDLVSRSAFRVCADPADLPFSDREGAGFENEIAELFAERLGRALQYTYYPMAQGFVRRTLVENNCDVIIGYAQGDELVLNTNHYYTSTHVLITRADGDLADVTTLADPRLQGRRIGVIAGTPPASHLARHGLMDTVRGYRLMVDTRYERPNEDMLADLIAGELDAAVMWGPIGGPLAQGSDADLVVTPLLNEPGSPRLFYRITMGVRQSDDVWKRELNSLIRELQPEIDAILRARGVPLVDDMGATLKAEAEP
jgi:quinoprotein dehydrogenase-associated probable ABC transporter substrate-binding protein